MMRRLINSTMLRLAVAVAAPGRWLRHALRPLSVLPSSALSASLSTSASGAEYARGDEIHDSTVKIFSTALSPSFFQPWQVS